MQGRRRSRSLVPLRDEYEAAPASHDRRSPRLFRFRNPRPVASSPRLTIQEIRPANRIGADSGRGDPPVCFAYDEFF